MGILDTLFGRQKPVPIGPERLFAMSTAQITLETEQDLAPAGEAAMCFKGVASGPFKQIQTELDELLKVAGQGDNHVTYRTDKDNLGYTWLIFASADFQTLVTTMHVASRTLLDQGYGSQLLFAIFPFKTDHGS
ncbi:MAG: PspA-associated protein PspAB, partial [Ktedonobacterales bacterium]